MHQGAQESCRRYLVPTEVVPFRRRGSSNHHPCYLRFDFVIVILRGGRHVCLDRHQSYHYQQLAGRLVLLFKCAVTKKYCQYVFKSILRLDITFSTCGINPSVRFSRRIVPWALRYAFVINTDITEIGSNHKTLGDWLKCGHIRLSLQPHNFVLRGK